MKSKDEWFHIVVGILVALTWTYNFCCTQGTGIVYHAGLVSSLEPFSLPIRIMVGSIALFTWGWVFFLIFRRPIN